MNPTKKAALAMAVTAGLVAVSFASSVFAATTVALAYPGQTSADLGLTTDTSANSNTTNSSTSSATVTVTSATAPVPTSASTVLGISVGADGSFNASQADVSAGASTETAANVSSNNTLALYAQGVLQSDSNVSGIAADSNHVAVSYYEPAKVFGFISAKINTTAEVDASGNASIHYPWYRFLTSVNDSDIQASVSAQAAGSASTFSSAQTKAVLVSDLYTALKAHADASASANVSANASTTSNYYGY